MSKEEDYRVTSHTFLGCESDGDYRYEIVFNKSLVHTGRFKGIEDGLNDYVRKEKAANFLRSIPNVFRTFWIWIKSIA